MKNSTLTPEEQGNVQRGMMIQSPNSNDRQKTEQWSRFRDESLYQSRFGKVRNESLYRSFDLLRNDGSGIMYVDHSTKDMGYFGTPEEKGYSRQLRSPSRLHDGSNSSESFSYSWTKGRGDSSYSSPVKQFEGGKEFQRTERELNYINASKILNDVKLLHLFSALRRIQGHAQAGSLEEFLEKVQHLEKVLKNFVRFCNNDLGNRYFSQREEADEKAKISNS